MAGEEHTDNFETSTTTSLQNEQNQISFNDQEKEWLIQAEEQFHKMKLESCLKCIENLKESFDKNYQSSKIYSNLETKLFMNKSLCNLSISNYKNMESFKEDLFQICQKIKLDLTKLETLEDLQHSILFYNYAIILYYNKQYSDCLKIIDKLYYQFNELLDEKLFREINFVFVDVLLQLRKPIKALGVLQNIKSFNRRGSNQFSNSSTNLQSIKTNKDENNEPSEQSSEEKTSENEADSNNQGSDSQYYQQLVSMFKLKCYFMMNSWKLFEKELKSLIDNLNIKQMPSNIFYLKSQESYLINDYPSCFKHLINNFINSFNLKTNLNFLQKLNELVSNDNRLNLIATNANTVLNDFYLNLLSATDSLTIWLDGPNSKTTINDYLTNNYNTTLFLNNLALVHFSLKKYSLSCLYLKKSLDQNKNLIEKYKSDDINNNINSKNITSHEESLKTLLKKQNLHKTLMNRQYEIMYNLGITLLFNKQPVAAFECLYKCVNQYNQNSRLWLRLAECCIICYRHSLNNDSSQFIKFNSTSSGNEKIFKLSEKIKCIKKSFGTSFHHKIQIGSSITSETQNISLTLNDFKNQNEETDKLESKLLTLDFAYMCLKNALNLIPSNQQIFSNNKTSSLTDPILNQLRSSSASKLAQQNQENLEDGTDINDSIDLDSNELDQTNEQLNSELSPNQKIKRQIQQKYFNIVWPSKPINLAELQNLRCSILISLSYVSLCLKDYQNTVKYCNILLDNNDLLNSKYPISKGNKLLSHSYLAEALLYLDKISDSIEHLSLNSRIESDIEISFVPSLSQSENNDELLNENLKSIVENRYRNHQADWFPKDVNTIRAISYYNLSVAHAVRGETEIASKHFNTSVTIFDKHKKHPAHAFLMKIYLDLLDGNRQSLQMVLKDHFPHTTLNRPILNLLNISANNLNQSQKQGINQLQQLQQQHQIQQQQQQQQQQQGQLPQNLAFLQLQQQQQQQQIQLQQQLQMQQLQHQLQQHQLQQLQQQQQQPLLQSQNLNNFLNNQNANLLMNSFSNNNSQVLPPALSPFNQTNLNQSQNNITNLLNQAAASSSATNTNNANNLNSAFANLPNLNGANILSTLATLAAASNNSNLTSNTNGTQIANLTSNLNNPLSLFSSGSLQQNQLNVNPLLLQQQQQQQTQGSSSFLNQNQLPSRIS